MLAILVEGAHAFVDLLVLLIVVALGARFINGGDDVVWSVVAILTRLGALWPITATVPMVTTVIIAAVAVAPIFGVIVATASWAMSTCILVEAHFGFLASAYWLVVVIISPIPVGGLR